MESLEKFFNSLLILIFVVVIVLYLFQPAKLGVLVGYSMTPTMTDGDLFIYEPGDTAEVNDVIVFESDEYNKLVAHRVVEKNSTHYITKGDNNTVRDSPVRIESSNYKGRMERHISTPWEFPIDQDSLLRVDNVIVRAIVN